jgi:hypothetical protein
MGDEMTNDQIYQLFIHYLDEILMDFDDLKDNCPADFDEELSQMIVRAHNITQCAYGHALANKEK